MDVETAVPLGLFAAVVAIVWVAAAYATASRTAYFDAVRAAVERGGQLSPELIRALGAPRGLELADIRCGGIWIAVAAACVVFGAVAVTEMDDVPFRVFVGIAAFPGFIGLAVLGFGIARSRSAA